MTDENVTRKALTYLARECRGDAYATQEAADAWFRGEWQECARWLLDANEGRRGDLVFPAWVAARLLWIAHPDDADAREWWVSSLDSAESAEVRAEMEDSR